MFWLIFILTLSLMVGWIAKIIYNPGDAQGCLPTTLIGVGGFYIGGFINFLLGRGEFLSMSHIPMGIVGAVIVCVLYRKFETKQVVKMRMRNMK